MLFSAEPGEGVDLHARGVRVSWRPRVQIQLIKCVREVTLSVWTVMLQPRRAALLSAGGPDLLARTDKNPPPTDAQALAYWAEVCHFTLN